MHKFLAVSIAELAGIIGAVALTGWITGITILSSWELSSTGLQPSACIGLILAAGLTGLLFTDKNKLVRVFSVILLTISVSTFLQYSGFNALDPLSSLGKLNEKGVVKTGLMSIHLALSYFLTALFCFLCTVKLSEKYKLIILSILLGGILTIALLVSSGYMGIALYSLSTIAGSTVMSIPAAVGTLLLGISKIFYLIYVVEK